MGLKLNGVVQVSTLGTIAKIVNEDSNHLRGELNRAIVQIKVKYKHEN